MDEKLLSNNERLQDYDSEPVEYCSRCYSLKIKYEDTIDADCCADCGCSDILTTTIDKWEELYKNRYGAKFIEKGTDPKKSPIFKLPIKKLKEKVYYHNSYKDIIFKLYPNFPRKLSKAESVILLFDKLTRDNRLDDLRLLLLNQ